MTIWEKPKFEDLAMNAEIGAYQADDWESERQYERFVSSGSEETTTALAVTTHA